MRASERQNGAASERTDAIDDRQVHIALNPQIQPLWLVIASGVVVDGVVVTASGCQNSPTKPTPLVAPSNGTTRTTALGVRSAQTIP